MQAKKIKILLIAEMCNPEWQSVPLVGWHHARALRELHDVHIITRSVNRDALLRAGLVEGQDFTVLDFEKVEQAVLRVAKVLRGGESKGWTILQALSVPLYYYFEHLLWKKFKKQLIGGSYDLVHRLTPLSPIQPSRLAKKCAILGVPFVVGPLNGGLRFPPQFRHVIHAEREWLWHLRFLHKLLPAYRSTRRYARAIMVGSRSCAAELPARYRDKAIYIPENGIDPACFSAPAARAPGGVMKAIFIGRLTPYKGCDIVLEALQEWLQSGQITLDVFGVGPMQAELEEKIHACGVKAAVMFHGNVPQKTLAAYLAKADVMPFPSVREFGGGVVLEAMASGVVPLVADYGGPGEHVAGGAGVALPLDDRAAMVHRLRATIADFMQNPEKLQQYRAAGLARIAQYYTWQAKAQQTTAVYDWVLGHRATRPDWGMPFIASSIDDAGAHS